jgi:hypothetical protein
MAQVLPFNGFYAGNSAKNSSRTCVNFMPMRHDAGALSEYTLQSTTGITSVGYKALSRDPKSIASHVFSFDTIGLIDANVCAISGAGSLVISNGNSLDIIQLIPGTFNLLFDVMTSNSKSELLVVDKTGSFAVAQNIYTYNADTSTATAIDISTQLGNNVGVKDTAFLGSRFLLMSGPDALPSSKGRVYYSDIDDVTTYNSANFFALSTQNSDNIGIHVLNERVYLFTSSGFSVFTNTPNVNSPFIAQLGSSGSLGLSYATAKAELGGRLYLIGREGAALGFYVMSSGGYKKISTDYIDQDIKGIEGGFVFSFSDDGRDLVGFSIGVKTYCYDTSIGEFHIRSSNGGLWECIGSMASTNGNNVFYGATTQENVSGLYLISNGKEDKEIGTEFDIQVARECVTSPFNSNGVTNNVRELSFITDIDYTTASPSPAVAPQLGLSVSKTFGKTFETEKFSDFDIGTENTKILRFLNIGFFRQAFVFKIKTNNIYPHKILKMLVKLQKGFRQI